jgi:hypothetical protein
MALKEYCRRIGEVDNPVVLNEHETLNGIGSMRPIVLSTSTGYVSEWYADGKHEIFDVREGEVVDGVQEQQILTYSDVARERVIPVWGKPLLAHLEDMEKDLAEGKEPLTVWTATLKDELLTRKKVDIAKTRAFVQPGIDFTILMRKYFGHMSDVMKTRAGFALHHGIGADKETVWGLYYEELKSRGGKGFDLDYSDYDGSVCQQAIDFFLQVSDHFYGEVGKKQRHALIASLRDSKMLVGRYLVETMQGNKSGNPLTDLFNSITNVWFVYSAYLLCRGTAGKTVTMDHWDAEVRMLTYGDDVILGVTDDCLEWFNRIEVKAVADLVGMRVTAADKDKAMVRWDDIETLTFLKSPFIQRDGFVASPLPLKVIHRQVMWQRKANANDAGILKQKIMDSVEMMAHHGREAVDNFIWQLHEVGVTVDFWFRDWEAKMRAKQEFASIEGVSPGGRVILGSKFYETPEGFVWDPVDWSKW